MSIPNQITIARLVLSIVLFVLLARFDASHFENTRWTLIAGFWVFLAAAVSDIIDGQLARRLGQITTFGRIVDPLADKVLICGVFVFFAGHGFSDGARNITGVHAWMALVVMLRELLVTALRAQSEAAGKDFSAVWSGKLKMFSQSLTAGWILAAHGYRLDWAIAAIPVLLWTTILITIWSMHTYVWRARTQFFAGSAMRSPQVERRISREPAAPLAPPAALPRSEGVSA